MNLEEVLTYIIGFAVMGWCMWNILNATLWRFKK